MEAYLKKDKLMKDVTTTIQEAECTLRYTHGVHCFLDFLYTLGALSISKTTVLKSLSSRSAIGCFSEIVCSFFFLL